MELAQKVLLITNVLLMVNDTGFVSKLYSMIVMSKGTTQAV